MDRCTFRPAVAGDEELILSFICALADYEKMSDQVVATPELLREWLFEKKTAEVIFAEVKGKAVGYALFFYNFSTFLGRAGIYLEDLIVLPQERGHGYGKALLRLMLEEARRMGITEEILVTVYPENIPSRRVAEANGGELRRETEERVYYWFR